METKAWAVDRPFIFPNWFRSRTGVSMSWSQSATKDSKTLASTGRREIGRKSEEIGFDGWTFGAGTTIADFQM